MFASDSVLVDKMTSRSNKMQIDDILEEFEAGASRTTKKETSANLHLQLTTVMLNERMAPELLPYQHHLLDRVLSELLRQQQHLLDSYEYGDSNAEAGVINSDFKLQLMIIETEIERLSYLVRLYIRTRLAKIDSFTIYYINETAEEAPDAANSLLSRQEKEYMHKHFKILTQLYNDSFLKKFPNFLTFLDDTSGGQLMISTPNLDQPVFIRVQSEDTIELKWGNEEYDGLDLVKDGVYVVRYRLIKRYIETGDVVLI